MAAQCVGGWAIREATLLRRSAYPPLPGGCVSAAREAWSAKRLTLSVHLESTASFLAVVGGYEGKNVTLDAGPVWFRSTWSCLDDQERTVTEPRYARPGAVVTLREALPAGRNTSAGLMLQYRFLGSDEVPYSSPRISADRSGLFISLGLGVRAMP
ncbi:MAG: hypothetical protein KY466_09395 [Gemmatimonadetes bacterium]|nr:hypothetical protein [Gemmatimonadota bacterium]